MQFKLVLLSATAATTVSSFALAGQSVKAIQWTGVANSGSYSQITNMAANGVCSSKPKPFSGPMAPYDEEISLHFRGPIRIVQFAAYMPATVKKREEDFKPASYLHNHWRVHKNPIRGDELQTSNIKVVKGTMEDYAKNVAMQKERRMSTTTAIDYTLEVGTASRPEEQRKEKRADWVVITMNGQVVSWINNWFGPPAPTPAVVVPNPAPTTLVTLAAPKAATATVKGASIQGAAAPVKPTTALSMPKVTTPASPPVVPASGSFSRTGFYDAKSKHLDGLTFLGNHGGQGSGVFDYKYGLSLAYSNAAGTAGASGPTVLSDTIIPSNNEVIIMTDKKCAGDSCGYYRPGSVAYHGFGGASKIFLVEFSMPLDSNNNGFNADMPAIWALNAQIPRTMQYGACSCWQTGCGEFDILEVLSKGSMQGTTSFHGKTGTGVTQPNWIQRPTTTTMKLAVVFGGAQKTIQIQVLPDSTNFGTGLTAAQVSALLASTPGSVSKWAAS